MEPSTPTVALRALRLIQSYPLHFHFFFWLVILTCATASAQKDNSAIAGLVKDSSGAVVSDAEVTITDTDRGTSLVLNTNAQGEYVASPLKIGRYNVTVKKAGFKKAVAGPIVVNVQERPEIDVTLQVGRISETMTVNTESPQLETETSELGQVVDSRRATTLPLNGRNYAQLALLGAGVAPGEPGSRVSASYGFSANGARSLQNNFLLGGVDNNANLGDVLNESAFVIQPSVDAIAEFKVQTNSYSAEFGRGNGAILNAVIKSGTNGLHSDVYEFLRNDKLDARNAFDAFGRTSPAKSVRLYSRWSDHQEPHLLLRRLRGAGDKASNAAARLHSHPGDDWRRFLVVPGFDNPGHGGGLPRQSDKPTSARLQRPPHVRGRDLQHEAYAAV